MKGRSVAEVAAGLAILVAAAGFLVFAIAGSGRSMRTEGNSLTLTARFDRIDGLAPGADVRIAGVKVGNVASQRIDPQTFLAVLTLRVDGNLRLPDDTSAEITSEGLLGGKYVALVPGGGERLLRDGGDIRLTQSAVSLESLLGRFIFSVTEMNANRNNEGGSSGAPSPGPRPAPAGSGPR